MIIIIRLDAPYFTDNIIQFMVKINERTNHILSMKKKRNIFRGLVA